MTRAWGLVLWVGWFACGAVACGLDDEAAGADRGGGSFDGGVPEAPGPDTGAAGTDGDAGGQVTAGPRVVVQCDGDPGVASCGSLSCPLPDPFALQSCRVACCTLDDRCGLLDEPSGACVASPLLEPGCPDAVVALGMDSETLGGCCTSSGTCGAVAFGACLPRERLGLGVLACDTGDAGVDDAGSAP